MKRLIQWFTVLLLLLSLQGIAFAETKDKDAAKEKVSILFVVASKQASITKGKDGVILSLNFPDKKILYFSDRPIRLAGHISLDKFVAGWDKGKDSFKADPPNAVLVHEGSEAGIPLELTSVSLSKDGNTLSFSLTSGTEMEKLEGVFLFIDVSHRWPD